jgi:MFS family permease
MLTINRSKFDAFHGKLPPYGPSSLIFRRYSNVIPSQIPTELFPTQYRASAFAITFSFGKIGVLIGQTITTFYSTNSKGWIWYLLATVPLLFAAALFSWVWLPTYGKLRGKPDIRSSNMSTLEELARGRKGRKEIEWQGFGGAWKSLWRRSHQDSELSV